MRSALATLALGLAALAPRAGAAADPASPPDPSAASVAPGPAAAPDPSAAAAPLEQERGADVRTIAGKVAALRWDEGRFTLEAADGPVSIRVDRNTMVLLEARAGTLRDLTVGLPVRASVRGVENLASFVEVRQRGLAPTSARDPKAGEAAKPDLVKDPAGGPADAAAPSSGASGAAGTGAAPPTSAPVAPPQGGPGPAGPSPVPGGTGTGR
jgi:hypothetical protein